MLSITMATDICGEHFYSTFTANRCPKPDQLYTFHQILHVLTYQGACRASGLAEMLKWNQKLSQRSSLTLKRMVVMEHPQFQVKLYKRVQERQVEAVGESKNSVQGREAAAEQYKQGKGEEIAEDSYKQGPKQEAAGN